MHDIWLLCKVKIINFCYSVHCRQRKLGSRKHAIRSTSSNTYWQIEKDDDSKSGM